VFYHDSDMKRTASWKFHTLTQNAMLNQCL